ncbi:NAD(P)H-dependent oxidoreductase [Marinivivus vitaminiproducens]|uniref:NAD(P)H-dependent oxidoreductase n=1 Tax=Marinivivus vitaminiproducens TaxID=3035935 RepID=UPI0027A11DBC|nr:SAF domain-containing protein [Geminicoccaceae bacterium SCSIO 64248]
MNLSRMLRARAEEGRPVKVGLIGAGKFGSMFLAQVRTTVGLHLFGVAELSAERARAAMTATGWSVDDAVAPDFDQAARTGRTVITEDSAALIASDIDVIVDATGSPAAAIRHAKLAFKHGKHVVMVTVEADALAGPWLARQAREAGVVYSMAYGDQPALVCEMIDWAHSCGFKVVAAGKGTRYMPAYHESTPATVWTHFGITDEEAKQAGMNPQMFNSFVDGTKSAIEMAAISNATGLKAPSGGLLFPPAGTHDLARVLCPKADGGVLEQSGMVEVVTDYERDGRAVHNDLRWGVYVVFEAAGDEVSGRYTRRCFREYGMATDPSGRYTALYRPFHLIGLELGVSVASAALRGEPTGAVEAFNSDVVSVTKKDLQPGDTLDGEGGYAVWGRIMPASASLAAGGLPIGLAHGIKVTRPVAKGSVVTWDDVEMPKGDAVDARRALEDGARGAMRNVA